MTTAAPAVLGDIPAAEATDRQKIKAIVAASSGNLVEWYDFYAYAFTSIYFASAFFPSSSPTGQLLATASIFAMGFFMRPLGGWLFGWLADKRGRRLSMLRLPRRQRPDERLTALGRIPALAGRDSATR